MSELSKYTVVSAEVQADLERRLDLVARDLKQDLDSYLDREKTRAARVDEMSEIKVID